MDPISLGIAAAALFAAKVIEKLGERTGDKVADSVGPIRDEIAKVLEGGHRDTHALEQVERTPDSRIAVSNLASAIADAAQRDPEGSEHLIRFMAQSQLAAPDNAGATFQVNMTGMSKVDRLYQANRDIVLKDDPGIGQV